MGTEKVQHEYGADEIQILEGLEAVRKRPGMYIGSTSARGLHHLVYEIVDNAVDEALAGFCDTIYVTINKDNSVTVIDNGRGIPVGINHKAGLPAVEVVFTVLHAGGKFGGGGYKVSGGLHGVGASVVNALSNWLEVEIYHEGKVYQQRYERGKVMEKLTVIGDCEEEKTGTKVTFLPDDTIFETTIFDFNVLKQRFREMAFLTKGLRISLTDLRDEEPKERVFHYEGGIKEFVQYLNRSKTPLYEQIIYCEGTKDNVEVEVAMQHNDSYTDNTYGFVNNITTPEGGTHVVGFRNAITKTFNDYARKNKLLKDSEPNLSGEDIREGLTAIISVKIEDPQFEGQTKGKLGSTEMRTIVSNMVYGKLTDYFEENPAVTRQIFDKALGAQRAREAARALNRTASERIDRLLLALADAVEAGTEELLAANARDRSRMNPADPAYDRLLLDRGRLLGIAADLRNVAALPSPLGRILDRTVRPNGMEIRKISVPFGVVGVIYEARPNVGFDVFALCVKSGNACILKGGSDARDSNAAIAALIRRTLAAHGFDENTLALLPPTHEATAALLGATGLVDLVIPRGGRGLIDFVRDHARVPVIETGAGVCHAYFDRSGDTEKGAAIVLNAKTRRVSVCNALDTLVVHRDRLTDLPRLCRPLAEKGVELQADEAARTALHGNYPAALLRAANTASFGTEFLSLRLSIRTVVSLDEALAHIARYSSQHSETIIAEDAEAIRTFQREVDAACVYANVSTAFTDGAQFGMGAEIGISTQKLHARGPMALRELTSYK